MNVSGILLYVGRAARFALAVCAAYAAGRFAYLKHGKADFDLKRELLYLLKIGYLAALAQIVALRGGPGDVRRLQWIPLRTTLETARAGLWPFVYNFAGNILWFVPLGMMLRKKKPLAVLLTGAAASASLEILQWLLSTGVTDVDDVIVNALGALVGYAMIKMIGEGKRK